MKILFLGHYRNNDDAGVISQNFILSMHKAKIDILCRHIYAGSELNPQVDPIIHQLENNNKHNCDICIQYLSPQYLIGTTKFKKNIAILNADDIEDEKTSSFIYHYKVFDEVWVFDEKQKKKLEKEISNIKIISPPSDSIKQQIKFMYNSPDKNIEHFSLENVGKAIKEILSA